MLKISNASITFFPNTINEKKALSNVDLTLNDGDFVTVIGGNGAGKSTILNIISGVHPVDTGTIEINDHNITKLKEHARAKYIGRVFQDPMIGTAGDMTIEENMAMAMRRGKSRGLILGTNPATRKKFREMLSMLDLGLEDRLTTKAGLLSGGQRQAITLLMATLQRPDLLLLDEHTAALDPKTAAKVLEITDKIITEEKLTALMITHNMKDALTHGNRLIMLHEGKIVVDVPEETKSHLSVNDLLQLFEKTSGEEFASDRALLS